ncbi:uncharacterized protein LOC120084848 [Benincasa hispida]|uniref:uncharacterized protein LOC120084848 n=1 Tax=Benincasa hispida TaxID=102211 RepID=UPI0018FFD9B6|nr:uncharacterized protein LOC120084848 [Benincasa hispida]
MNEALQKIKARMQQSQSRQKGYDDVRRKDLEFETGVKVFLKVAPMKDPSHVVDYEPLLFNDNLSYEEKPIEILVKEVKALRHRKIAFVKVLWQNHQSREATWKREDEMKAQYPELFQG